MDTVLKYNNIDFSKIIFDEFMITDNKEYIVSKMWYQKSEFEYPRSLHIQTPLLKIDEITKSNNIVLNTDDNITTFFDKIDELTLDFVKSSSVTKKYGLKNIKFVQIVKEISKINNVTESKNVLKLKIMNTTKFFTINNKSSLKYENVKKMLKPNGNIRTILELDGIIIDIAKNEIFVNVILRQVLIHKMNPIKVELTEYSFILLDDENTQEKEKENSMVYNINDVVINTNTEYLGNNNKIETDTEKINKTEEILNSSEEKSQSVSESDSDMSTESD